MAASANLAMQLTPSQPPLALRDRRDWIVRVNSGVVWLTVAGEAGDVFLAAGQWHRVAARGLVLVEPAVAQPATIELRPPRSGAMGGARPWLRRIFEQIAHRRLAKADF